MTDDLFGTPTTPNPNNTEREENKPRAFDAETLTVGIFREFLDKYPDDAYIAVAIGHIDPQEDDSKVLHVPENARRVIVAAQPDDDGNVIMIVLETLEDEDMAHED